MKRLALISMLMLAAQFVGAQDSVSTLAGLPLLTGLTNGPAANAVFNDPAALACDSAGNIYIADSQNHVVRKIDSQGSVSTFAAGQFDTPSGIAVAPDGSVYVSDTGNHTIRKISAGGAVATIAGTAGQTGFVNGLRAAARFNSPL